MKKLILSVVVIGILFAGTWYLFMQGQTRDDISSETDPDYVFPTNDVNPPNPDSDGYVPARNFLKDDNVTFDTQNEGYAYLGNRFVENENEKTPNYVITYIQQTQFFNVTLLQEPLQRSRLEAEEYLKKVLGIPEVEMCRLQYTVSVPGYVSEEYSGIDFRLSFCSDSINIL